MYKPSYFIKFILLILSLSACSAHQAFRAQTSKNYTVRPGDVVRIELSNYPEYNQELFINFSGSVRAAAIGKVVVNDFTLSDLEVEITSKYSQVLTDPIVHVEILSRTQQVVYVAGKIKKPGIVRYKHKLTVAQSITLAGGVRNAGREYCTYVLRKKTDGGWSKFKIELKRRKSSSEKNNGAFKLAPYDIVYVTKSTETDAGDLTYSSGFGTEI